MGLLNAGRNSIAAFIIGNGTSNSNTANTFFNSGNAHVGVGDGTTAFNASHTDNQGSNKTRKLVDAGYPTISTNVLTFRATFGTSEGNHRWREWGIFNAATGQTMLNRKVQDLDGGSEKTSAESWQITATLTVTAS
jgi:hypothetical protein